LVNGSASLTPPRQLNPAISAHVAQAIECTLQTRPTDRFATANKLSNALQPPPAFTPSSPAAMPQPLPSVAQPAAPVARQAAPRQKAQSPRRAPAVHILVLGGGGAAILGLFLLLLLAAFIAIRERQNAAHSSASATAAPTAVQPAESRLGDTWIRPIDGMVMVHVPAPSAPFTLGSGLAAPAESYWIDKYEVTNGQYRLCVAAGVCERSALDGDSRYNGADQPVVGVSWHDAAAYAAWVGGALPTEEEWEYAASGAANTTYPWGNVFDGTRLNFCDVNCPFDHRDRNWNDGYAYTAPVGSYPDGESWVGAADMVGNVWEWTDSLWEAGEPWRVLRGGSFSGNQYNARAAYRFNNSPDYRDYRRGFRVVVVRRSPSHLDP
jgi:hypothetical protein